MQLLILGLLLTLPAFFAAGEVSLLRLRPSRVQRLVEEHKAGAKAVHKLQKRLRRALIVSQLGGTLALVSLGWAGRSISLKSWPNSTGALNTQLLDFGLFLLIILTATLIAGLLPKAIVLNRPEKAALKLAPVLDAVMRFLSPLITLLEAIASILFRLVGLNSHWDSLVPALSAEELETLIESGGVTGLRPDERNILEGVFALRDTQVREVMVPRSGMATLPINVKFAELMKAVHQTKHARFLVTGESLDDIKGVLDLRQLAKPISEGSMNPNTPLEPYLKEAPRVLETSKLSDLLPFFRNGEPLLLVVDEHGGTEGLVTAADLTGEIVGEDIQTDHEGPEIQPLEGHLNRWLVAGDVEIIELNKQLKLELPEASEHHTLAGFLLERLQYVPSSGDSLVFKSIKFEINQMKGPRIQRVKLTKLSNEFPDRR